MTHHLPPQGRGWFVGSMRAPLRKQISADGWRGMLWLCVCVGVFVFWWASR